VLFFSFFSGISFGSDCCLPGEDAVGVFDVLEVVTQPLQIRIALSDRKTNNLFILHLEVSVGSLSV
jgi:hypothetical protein